MTTNLKWRLSKLPTPEEVTVLVKDGILTKDEAREILFSLETEEDRDKVSLQEEIKFLRQLVQSLSTRSNIVEHIYMYEKPYSQQPWYQPYIAYCGISGNSVSNYLTGGSLSGSSTLNLVGGTANYDAINSMTSQGLSATYSYTEPNFTDISTF